MPMVSIITPCYNGAAFVERTVQSVRAQSIDNWEHVVVDDGSTDDSATILTTIGEVEPRLRVIRQENRGVAAARNAGFCAVQAASRYLLFLDADDCLASHMLASLTKYLDLHPDVGMVYCGHTLIDANDQTIPPARAACSNRRYVSTAMWVRQLADNESATPFESVFVFAGILPSFALIRRSVYDQTPGWDERFGRPHEDTELFLHIAIRSMIHYAAEPLVMYRRHAFQNTACLDPRQFDRQERKLRDKWTNMPGLTAQQRLIVARAIRFREGCLVPHRGIQSAVGYLRRGEVFLAARFFGGAIRRYGAWLL